MFSWLEIVDSKRFWTAPNWPREASTDAMNLSISFKVVCADWADETENASIPECVFSADVPTPVFDAIPLILKPLDKEIEIVSSPLAPTCKTTLPLLSTSPLFFPAKTCWPAKVVLQEILVI